LLSLGGIPPTAGFFGKFYLFRAALSSPNHWMTIVVVIAVLNSVVSVAYYLRIVMAMYFRESGRELKPLEGRSVTVAIAISAAVLLGFGILPDWLLQIAR
jgi:NADH-quinone oxidoreductase subunit N